MVSALAGAIFSCGNMELQGSHTTKPLPVSFGVAEMHVFLNSGDRFRLAGQSSRNRSADVLQSGLPFFDKAKYPSENDISSIIWRRLYRFS